MMHEVDVEVGILVQDEFPIGGALVVERIVRDRRESRLQSGESLQRGLRARIFLAVEREAAVLAADWHQALVEMAALDGSRCPLLAFKAQFVDILPRDAFKRRHRIGADALMRLRMFGAEAKIAVVHHERPLAAAALHRHHLGATRDHEILGARHDGIGSHVDAGDAGTAEPIQRDGAGAHVIAGIERRHPAKIAALLAPLRAGAPDDVVDVGGVDAGTIGQRAQYRCAELLRMDARQGALAGLADAPWRPACIDDQRVNHGASLKVC